jgi:hypothetical protein
MKRKTPQEKKLSAYVRDGRNLVAESRSIAHRAISKRKTWVNKSFRKAANQALASSLSLGEESLDQAELASSQVEKHEWRKQPDVPLATYVQFKQGFVAGKRDQLGIKTELRSLAARLAKAKYGR